MTQFLTRSDLLGRRIRELRSRVSPPIPGVDPNLFDGLDCLDGIVVLDTGQAFHFPILPAHRIRSIEIPADAAKLDDEILLEALASPIAEILCHRTDDGPGLKSYLLTESGIYIGHVSVAPAEVGYAGFHVLRKPPDDLDEFVPYGTS
jgi:hypothetical protein